MGMKNMRALMNRAIDKLPSDLKTVLVLRYGLGDSGKQSIRNISKQRNAKTFQVAHLETKAIRWLRRPALCVPFLKVLDEMDSFIWRAISEEISEAGSLIRISESYDMVMEALPGEISLAIMCRYGSLLKWIESNAAQAENAWFRSTYPHETVSDRVRQLVRFWNINGSPLLVSRLVDELQVDVVFLRFILALSPIVVGFYGGYAAERPITSPVLRAIRLHRLLLYQYADIPVHQDQIATDYNAFYHDDQINERLAQTIMQPRPHLFLEEDKQTWSALGTVQEQIAYAEIDDVLPDSDTIHPGANEKKQPFLYERPWSETTASNIVIEILEQQEFCLRKNITKLFLARTSGHYVSASAEAVLAGNDDILEAAPEVYGLRTVCNDIDPMYSWSETLLTRRACKSFLLERYAGEPLHAYPLWTRAMEQKWCIWAENNSELNTGIGFGGKSDRAFNRSLFQSLLFVSEPEYWPVSESTRSYWLFRKQTLAAYHFTKPVPNTLWQRETSLQDLFSVAVTSRQIGYANWVRASHAMGLGRHSLNAAGVLALLIVLEMITPSDNWQRKHETGPQIDSELLIMVKEIRKKGFVHWMDDTGKYFRDRLREGISRVQLGWVSANWVQEFLDVLEESKTMEQSVEKLTLQPMTEALSHGEQQLEAQDQLTLPFFN